MPLYGYHTPSMASHLRVKSMFQAMGDHIEHQERILQLLKENLAMA